MVGFWGSHGGFAVEGVGFTSEYVTDDEELLWEK